jgi:hypothetical protein
VITKTALNQNHFAKLIGLGDMNLEVEANDLDANLNGSGD